MIRVLVVDDHPIVREGLVAVLEDDPELQVVGTAGSAEGALALAASANPDVVLLDLELPGMSGLEAIAALATAAPQARVVIFTAYEHDEHVRQALQAGAKGYLLKGAPAEEIARAIRAVHAGGSYLEARVAAKVVALVQAPRGATPLSRRERDVLKLVAAGLSNKQIAARLGVAERTAKFHVASIFNKLGAENRAQAVALATQRGLL